MKLHLSLIIFAGLAIVVAVIVLRAIWSTVSEGIRQGIAESNAEMAAEEAEQEALKAERAALQADETKAMVAQVAGFAPAERRGILLQAMFREFLFHGPLVALDWNEGNRHWLATYRLPHDKLEDARRALSREWDVEGADSLKEKIDWLLKQGHRAEIDEIFEFAGMSDAVVDEHLKSSGVKAVEVARNARERVGDARGNAFDVARAALLVGQGMALGMLDEEEGRVLLADCDEEARRWCGSWRQYGESFVAGGEIWMRLSGAGFVGIQRKWWRRTIDWLVANPLSPWLEEPWGGEEPGIVIRPSRPPEGDTVH